ALVSRERTPKCLEVVRRRGLEAHVLPRPRMPQAQAPRVQHRPRHARLAAAVLVVARDGMAERGEVDTDLVRPPGVELTTQQSMVPLSFQDGVPGARVPAAFDDGHPLAVLRVPADRAFELPGVRLQPAPNYGEVRAAQRAVAQLRRQRAMTCIVARDHDEAGRAAIEPVDDTRTDGAARR